MAKENEKNRHHMQLCLSMPEWERFQQAAQKHHLPPSTYARMLILQSIEAEKAGG